MSKSLIAATLSAILFTAGCFNGRIVMSTDAKDSGDVIRTRYRYRIVSEDKNQYVITKTQRFSTLHPDVFSEDGIPIKISTKNTMNKKTGESTTLLPNITLGLVPSVKTSHLHSMNAVFIEGTQVATVDMCAQKGEAQTMLPFPTPLLFFIGDGEPCFSSGRVFRKRCSDMSSQYTDGISMTEETMAYGIASRLKEAEDAGVINDTLVARWRTVQSVADVGTLLNKIVKDEQMRRGQKSASTDANKALFDVVRCDTEKGKDFAYVFNVRRKGGAAVSLADYGLVRTALRSAIRTHYVSVHRDINPRTLEIDFTECALKGGAVVGRVAILTISPESLSYDEHRRTGVLRVKIGPGQFEDARRWIRRYLGTFANKKNIVLKGDALPQGARFFSEDEKMVDGVLEVSFRTE